MGTTEQLTDDEIRVKCAEAMFPMFPTYWDGGELRHRYPSGNTGPSHLYDKSVDSALMLCDRLRSEGWCLQITYGVTDKWTVTFYQGQGRFFTVQDPSLARAICLAFLKVKGEAK